MTASPALTSRQQSRLRPPPLPEARGPLSAAVTDLLRGSAAGSALAAVPPLDACSPYGDDLQLALYVLYELHYQGFQDVPDSLEWDSGLLAHRAALENRFMGALRRDVPIDPAETAEQALDELQLEPVGDDGTGVSYFLRDEGGIEHLRAYAAARSLYHLKEADPHAWVLPRLHGRAKAAMVAVEFDEFGGGRAEEIHAQLFADLMADLGLDTTYGHYVDAAPAEALATVNLMSLFGLHRALRAALVGHFAAVEVTSSPGSRRLAEAMRRVDAGPAAVRFYTEHVTADAVHEQVVRHDVVGGLLEAEPHLDADVVFGIHATTYLEDRLSAALLSAWHEGRTGLRDTGTNAGDRQVFDADRPST
ncbi:iron-containing redox enzyme family protein [Streptomyces sp. ME02-8801-2C]|uniref:iron-containing redox enzyme family protein n=1 Tax=Streptomyces sp. ME02-8801-2C TaxID=3028680 RepID=UPI0029A8D8C3|nr:iron-containing redox enzyme family protein [Streptomyces sp. ME02-8801-2C]MDX3453883.1 iron-containing redox enzyme family protein [Streptomyces sp. ME02-8801-2C]